ncbi:MAG: hypothetical protein QW597_06620 [Thermoplasmataceae archaeon]
MNIIFITFLIAVATLAVASYTDIRKRTINSFIFIPLVAVAAINFAFTGQSAWFIAVGILFFAGTFIRTDLYLYPIYGLVILIVSVFLFLGEPLYLTSSIMIFIAFELGFTERFFGIGDIKAMVAIFLSFITFPFTWAFTAKQAFVLTILPLSFAMLINIAIVSLYLPVYMLILNVRIGNRIGAASFLGLPYDDNMYTRNSKKFSIRGSDDSRMMIYRSPFMIPISIGFLITVIFGFWMIYV